MSRKLKSIQKFRSEAQERRIWETHDSGNYVDWSKTERALSESQAVNGLNFLRLAGDTS